MSVQSYAGKSITVTYDTETCQHAGECVRGLAAVFNPEQDPWIQPDAADDDQVIATIHACPSGALEYTTADGRSG
jgi:uncharacterized Fe-S cluster protein YjdI